ncbi:MAG: hypothetical protein ABL866_11755 [Devosia sp.]
MNTKFLLPLLALPLLAACAPEVETTIYLADVQAALDSGKSVAVPATLRIPQSGKEDCEKGLPDLVAKLKAFAPVKTEGKCVDGKDSTLAEIGTELQIVAGDATYDPVNLFVLEVATTDEGRSDLTFHMLKPIEDVVKGLAAEGTPQTDFDPSKFIIHVNNDGAGSVELVGNHVFIDDKPAFADSGEATTVDRRGEVTIKFSDVASSFVEQGNSYWFVTVGPAS